MNTRRYSIQGSELKTDSYIQLYCPTGQTSYDYQHTVYGIVDHLAYEDKIDEILNSHRVFIHTKVSYEYLMKSNHCSRVGWSRVNGVTQSQPFTVDDGENVWIRMWAYRDGPRPITPEHVDMERIDTQSLVRDAYAAFLNQNISMWAANALELEQTLEIIPSFVRGLRKTLESTMKCIPHVSTIPHLSLKQLGRVVVDLWHMAKRGNGIGYLDSSFSLAMKFYKPKVLRNILKRMNRSLRHGGLLVANSHLAFSFGVRPLYSDVRKALNASVKLVRSFRRGSATAKARCKISERIHWHYSLTKDSYVADNMFGLPYHNISGMHLSTQEWDADVRAVVSGNIEYPDGGHCPAIRRYLANGPASLALELIPLSFVIDWLVDTRIVIGELDAFLQGASIVVDSKTVSYKYDIALNAITHPWSSSSSVGFTSDLDGVTAITMGLAYYERSDVDLPQGLACVNKFGKRQGLLSLSLALQRIL